MSWDFCADVRKRIGHQLSGLGFQEVDCRQFGQHPQGHGAMYADQVAYYRGEGRMVAFSWSVGNGHGCWLGREGDNPSAYREWPTLWSALGMEADFASDNPVEMERVDAYLDEFPEGYDEALDYIAAKLAKLVTS